MLLHNSFLRGMARLIWFGPSSLFYSGDAVCMSFLLLLLYAGAWVYILYCRYLVTTCPLLHLSDGLPLTGMLWRTPWCTYLVDLVGRHSFSLNQSLVYWSSLHCHGQNRVFETRKKKKGKGMPDIVLPNIPPLSLYAFLIYIWTFSLSLVRLLDTFISTAYPPVPVLAL